MANKPAGSINSTWELTSYDVWGNSRDGYEVNQAFRDGSTDLRIPVTRYNADTPQEFKGAFPSMAQIREALDIRPRIRLRIDGDDLHIMVERDRDGYPIGEMTCTSHESLSPIRPKGK